MYIAFMVPKDIHRSCASIVVLRPSDVCSPDGCGKIYQVLLLHKPRKRDDWQFPQGGLEEGESYTQAAVRELEEEAGVTADQLRILGMSHLVYEYDFPASYRRFRKDHIKGQHIEFVFALAEDGAKVQVDDHEIDGYVWVYPEQLSKYIKRKNYLELAQKLVEEAQNLARKEQA